MIDEVVQKTNVLVPMILSATPDVFHKHTCIVETPNRKLLPSYKLVLTMTKSVLNFSKLLSGVLKCFTNDSRKRLLTQRLPLLHPSFRNANLVGVPYRTRGDV